MFSKHYHLSLLKLDEIVLIIGSQDLQKNTYCYNYTYIYIYNIFYTLNLFWTLLLLTSMETEKNKVF